jgi:hypothetical protein
MKSPQRIFGGYALELNMSIRICSVWKISGYKTCHSVIHPLPDQLQNHLLDQLLDMSRIGVSLLRNEHASTGR